MTTTELLLTPCDFAAWALPNRVAMAPMTRSRAEPGALPSRHAAEYYRQRAAAGLIVSEPVGVSAQALGYTRTPGLWRADQVAAWQAVTAAVHGAGGRILAQVWHTGRIGHPADNPEGLGPVGPSAVAAQGQIFTDQGMFPLPTPRELTADEIAATVADFAATAANAVRAGFDGIELHAANGYLFDQFFCATSNRRGDRHGGSLANRLRLLWEVLEVVGAVMPLDRVGVRLSPLGGFNDVVHDRPEVLFEALLDGLDAAGVGYVHLIEPDIAGDRERRGGGGEGGGAWVRATARRLFRRGIIVAGGYTRDRAAAVLAAGEADLVAFGRSFIANPDLVERFRRGAPLNEAQRATFYTTGPAGYIDYPALAD